MAIGRSVRCVQCPRHCVYNEATEVDRHEDVTPATSGEELVEIDAVDVIHCYV